jgi:uncharacterized membrane protein YqjE
MLLFSMMANKCLITQTAMKIVENELSDNESGLLFHTFMKGLYFCLYLFYFLGLSKLVLFIILLLLSISILYLFLNQSDVGLLDSLPKLIT